MYNWGELAYEGVVGKVGIALSFYVRVLLGRECIVFCFIWGVSVLVMLMGIGVLFLSVCLWGVGVSSVLPNFKALKLVPTVITGCLEVISLWIPAIVG